MQDFAEQLRVLVDDDYPDAADLILIGHRHHRTAIAARCVTLTRRGIATGHWLESHVQDIETYAEARMLPPSDIGCPVIERRPADETRRVVV